MIAVLRDPSSDRAEYLAEMIALWGGAWCEVVEAAALCQQPPNVAIVPPSVTPSAEDLLRCLAGGAHLMLIAPSRELLEGIGIDYAIEYGDDDQVARLRQVWPLLGDFGHHSLPIVGRRALHVGLHYSDPNYAVRLPPEASVWAYMYEPGTSFTDRPAIWTLPVESGKITVFNYDVIECYRNLRQGWPRYVGWRPSHDDICRPAYLFGPDWHLKYQGVHLPLADFHPMLLLRLVEEALDFPPPRLWQLPGTSQSAIIISGDEDCCDPEYNETICSFLDTLDANMVIYIQMQGTRTIPEQLQDWMSRGHGFSVHPYPTAKGQPGRAPAGDTLALLEACAKEFEERFCLAPRAIVNHRGWWAGYTDIPRLWERIGVQMDVNYGSSFMGRGFEAIYCWPSGVLPIRFMDEQLRRINVLQHPRAVSDDSFFSDGDKSMRLTPEVFETYGEALLTHTLKPLGTALGVCFHPANYVRYAGEAERRFLLRAKSHDAALLSDYEWLDFWLTRASWRLAQVTRTDSEAAYRFVGSQSSRQLTLSLPATHAGKTVQAVRIDGKECATFRTTHFGQERVLAQIPDGVDEAEVSVVVN